MKYVFQFLLILAVAVGVAACGDEQADINPIEVVTESDDGLRDGYPNGSTIDSVDEIEGQSMPQDPCPDHVESTSCQANCGCHDAGGVG